MAIIKMIILSIVITIWCVYSGLTIKGAIYYPIYTAFEKIRAILIILIIPFYGAYLVNKNMGYRIDEASKADVYYELPWLASFGIKNNNMEIDDE